MLFIQLFKSKGVTMPFRRIPQSILGFQKAMDDAKNKSANSPNQAITVDTLSRLNLLQPDYKQKVLNMNIALQDQMNATIAEDSSINLCRMYVSHFIQVLNMGIHRGIYPATARTFYGLDANQESLPELGKENDVAYWAQAIIYGDDARVLAGGAPMINPSATEIQTKFTDYQIKHNIQSEKKDTYDNALQTVSGMYYTVKKLVIDMWDEIEFFFRGEPDEASKRRKCREWGVVYESRSKATILGTVTDLSTGVPLSGVNVKMIETDESVITDESGNYELVTTLAGSGTMEFTKTGFMPSTETVEVHEGGSLTIDVTLKVLY